MTDLDAKSRIIKAVVDILDEVDDIDKITIRQIAERAGVGVGLVNYHFQTKDNLLNVAISTTMGELAVRLTKSAIGDNPSQRLKNMLIELCNFGIRHSKILKISVPYELLHGDMQANLLLVPLLRESFGSKKDEIELRIISMQILVPIQSIFVRSSQFQMYTGVDIFDEVQRNKLIDTMVDNLLIK